jgi:hypothetical protein
MQPLQVATVIIFMHYRLLAQITIRQDHLCTWFQWGFKAECHLLITMHTHSAALHAAHAQEDTCRLNHSCVVP